MQYYFVNASLQQEGPIEVSEFAAHGITAQTLVWREGLKEWTAAGDVEELQSLWQTNAAVTETETETTEASDSVAKTDNIYDSEAPKNHIPTGIWALVICIFIQVPIFFSGSLEVLQRASNWATLFYVIALLTVHPIVVFCIINNAKAYHTWRRGGDPGQVEYFSNRAWTLGSAALGLAIVLAVLSFVVCLSM